MAVYFDAAPDYFGSWHADSEAFGWDDYEAPVFEGQQDDWYSLEQDWSMKHQSPWHMSLKAHHGYDENSAMNWSSSSPRHPLSGSYYDYGATKRYESHQVHSQFQQSRRQPWGTSQAVFESLPAEPKEILVVKSTSSGSYASLCRDAKTADVVAFDAEWVPDFSYGSDNPISVLQLAFPRSKRVYVVQLEPLGKKLPQEVQLMLVNPDVLKAGFAVNVKDSQKLMRTGIAVTQGSLVDVQERSATSIGVAWGKEQSLSLRRAASELLGCELLKDKRCACSDWSCEQLTPEQVRYAALDAWVALRLYYLLH
eukprot:TRINITY_DN28851_c0_g1_i1.p1 TRINITY_DN28851_c0_g1~~TRINITY_DN28851_c0_g1_i1.p1  ORF type:complete len:310 (+),score=62.60 TRINITY_DN28851_c0_g1_i1:209-1138(+)